ncbi:hypothetical protein [Sandarakinorhabdus sp.]|uniref:hypothetical protein n=1 Tax=Sandarakinorhabdus sp. TaxID=1916663 RepID=UPI0028A6D3BE|nr:hypothetical protein [Sandarakinorhabdus sp.]
MMPAISDADLARLLGAGDAAPAMPAGLADRIMAALPAAASVPPLPPAIPLRRRRPRWLRAGVAVVAGLGLASAVAAGLARTPAFAPLLAPMIERLAEVTGLPSLAPRPQTATTTTPRPAPLRTAAPPARIEAVLPAPALQSQPSLPAPALLEAPHSATPDRLAAARPAPRRQERRLTTAAPIELRRAEAPRAVIERPVIDRPPIERPLIDRLGVERPLADRPVNALPEAVVERLQAHTADTTPAEPALPTQPLAEAVANRPQDGDRAAEVTAEIKALRDARSAGTLTAAQTQRMRALQQLRAARSARTARDIGPRRPH